MPKIKPETPIQNQPKLPATPSAAGTSASVATPLTPTAKRGIVEHFSQEDDAILNQALVNAALENYPFPPEFHPKLASLQAAYQANTDSVKEIIKGAIQQYFSDEGLSLFRQRLDQNQAEISSGLLCYLANFFGVKIEKNYLVQASVDSGKVYWRIMKSDKVVFCRKSFEEFDFDKAQCWYMTWEQFRQFKDSGKRGGTVAITKERFVDFFDKDYLRRQAAIVWDELKSKNVLNKHDRLSRAWRVLSNQSVYLDSLSDERRITKDAVVEKLKSLRGKDKTHEVTEEAFVKEWAKDQREDAGLIWDKLRQIGIINKHNKVPDLRSFEISNFLKNLVLQPEQVMDALYSIASDKKFKETLKGVPGATIFRSERGRKSLKNSGKVGNDQVKDTFYANRWDVSIYRDLVAHHNCAKEESDNKQRYGKKQILNFDHIPGCALLKQKIEEELSEIKDAIKAHKGEIKKLEAEIQRHKKALVKDKKKKKRLAAEYATDDEVASMENKITSLLNKIETLLERKNQLQDELKGHGDMSWSIAIPKELHRLTTTFMQDAESQTADSKKAHPLATAIEDYLRNIVYLMQNAGKSTHIILEECIYALGALRYLYHCQAQKVEAVDDLVPIGDMARQAFFKTPKVLRKLDTIFNEKMQLILSQKEGLLSEKKLDVKPLIFS